MNAILILTLLIQAQIHPQTDNLGEIRRLYSRAPLFKADSRRLDKLLLIVDSNSAPVLCSYKGAAEMIAAKYALNPVVKLSRFNKGRDWITVAVHRDTLGLEPRFIRFSVQNNLPAFLGYRQDLVTDKVFLLNHVRNCADPGLKKMIVDYLTASAGLTVEDIKQINK